MSSRIIAWIYVLLIFYTVAPLLCILSAVVFGSVLGIHANQGPQYILGINVAPLVEVGEVGWLAMFTLPTGGPLVVLYTVFVCIWLARQKREKAQS